MKYSDKVIEDFYNYLVDGDEKGLLKTHIPRSDVFYTRAAIEAKLGKRYSLEYIEKLMLEEGLLNEP